MEKRLENLEETVAILRDNHIAHLQADVTNLRVDMSSVKTDLAWLKENHWRLVVGIVLMLLATLAGIIIK